MVNNPLIYAVAGLLHDIGKFWQRADLLWKESENLEKSKGIIQQICPSRPDGNPGYQHVIWTYAFFDKYYSKFKRCGLADESMKMEQLINLASYHHKPSTPDQGLITLADICSSGLDRSNNNVIAKNPEWSWDKYKSKPFVSPFAVFLRAEGNAIDLAYPAKKMAIGERIFPDAATQIDNKQFYPELWKEFEDEFSKLPDANAESFIFSLYHLLKKYTSYIPASTQDFPESSLFEHMKTTGAFAHCFAAYKEEFPDAFGNENRVSNIGKDHYPIKLFCGDISGIQSFIYNITNKAAAKSLKGRSFYVQLLAESISQEILTDCGCSLINQVYAAGGKFYLILPNTTSVNNAIKEYRPRLEKELWEEFAGQLSVNMEGINFSFVLGGERPAISIEGEEVTIDIGALWKKLSDKTSAQKRKRFANVFMDSFEQPTSLFDAIGLGGDISVCSVSGLEVLQSKMIKLSKQDIEQGDDSDISIAPFVQKQINIGRDLYEHKFLVELIKASPKGYEAGISSKWNMLEKGDTANQQHIKNWIRTDHEDEIKFRPDGFTPHEDNGLGWRLYGGSSMAIKNGKPATFEEISKQSDDDKGSRLGVLRMDVDNLGDLFMKGFPENKRSFSALATLSSMLDMYFSGHLNYIRNNEKYKDRINIVYSGGDDVFAVGRWSELIDFAADIRFGFKKFVGERDDISLSGGIVMVGPKFPIAKAAELAGEAEELAKNFKIVKNTNQNIIESDNQMPDKNAFTLFGISLSWQHDWYFVVQFKNDLIQWVFSDEIISKGLLMKLFDYHDQYARGEPDWQWNSAYTLARMKSRDNHTKNAILDKIKILLYTGNYNNQFPNISFDTVIAAARWAEWEIKQLKK